MNSSSEIVFEFGPYLRAYKDGKVERFFGTDVIPLSVNSQDGCTIFFKDVQICPKTGISSRIFIPRIINKGQNLPLLIYFHGGGFVIGSPFCSMYHNYVASLVSKANAIAISVDYRLAPEYHIPIAYEDSWAALKWVASHFKKEGPEIWLNEFADFERVFLAGDSAGGNIVHNMVAQAGVEDLSGMKLLGACLVHPDFKNKQGDVSECWRFVCPRTSWSDDPRINPAVDSRLPRLGCRKVLICVAEEDGLKDGGLFYYESLMKSGWNGEVEILETEGERHVFHLFNPNCEKAVALLRKLASFINLQNL